MKALETALAIRARARAANPDADQATPLPAATLTEVRVEHGRATANLCEFPHWLLSRER